jgi:hypothetical protein
MKKINQLLVVVTSVLLFSSCKKTTTSVSPPGTAACKPTTESTTLSGNNATYEYTYGANGKVSLIKKFIGGGYHVLADSIVVGDYTIVEYYNSNYSGYPMIQTTVYKGSLDGMPTEAQVSLQEGAVTQTDVWHYFFFYDNKNRLNKVGEQTDHVVGDWEYDLDILYNDQDNVVGLKYSNTTGSNTTTTIPATGYDDKPNPFAGIKNWYFLMHAAWNNYDPEPLFTALSKNNPLGYTMPDGFKRTMTYNYNDKGFPMKRMNTNTNTSGSYSFEETYDYQCK